MLAYDKHMNFVLAECEEFRTVKVSPPFHFSKCGKYRIFLSRDRQHRANRILQGKKAKGAPAEEAAPTVQQKRTLGLVILRGETIVSVTVEGPPPVEGEDKSGMLAGPGKGVPAGRGMPLGGPGKLGLISFLYCLQGWVFVGSQCQMFAARPAGCHGMN